MSDSLNPSQNKEITETLKKVFDLMSALKASLGLDTNKTNQVRALRTKAKLTQSQLARLCGMRQANISAIELGKCYVGDAVKTKLANALKCNVSDLGLES